MFSSKKKKVLAVFAAIIMAASAVWYVAFPASADNHKVYVCKYVGTPGDDERLQTGQNPIEVSVNAAELTNWDGHSFGVFVDAHDRSFVLGPVPMTPEPTAADCPGPDNPPDEETIPVPDVPISDPCGPDNAVYGEVPSGNYTVTRYDDGSIRLIANDDYVFEGGDITYVFETPVDSNEPCPPGEIGTSGDVSVIWACESITIGQPTYSPADGKVTIKLNGKSVQPGIYGVKPGQYTVELLVNGEKVQAHKRSVKKCASGGNTGGSDLENPTYANTGH